jgi:hypothetical protein
MDSPNSHQGIVRPDKKNSDVFFPDFFETRIPISRTIEKNTIINE